MRVFSILSRFFSESDIERLARERSLVERRSPITGFKFLLAFTTGLLNTPDGTLGQLAGFLSGACKTERIQLLFDYLKGSMNVEIGDAKLSDPKMLEEIINERRLDSSGKSLLIQDLGYFKTATFAKIANNTEDFFISKLKFAVKISGENEEEINLSRMLKQKKQKNRYEC